MAWKRFQYQNVSNILYVLQHAFIIILIFFLACIHKQITNKPNYSLKSLIMRDLTKSFSEQVYVTACNIVSYINHHETGAFKVLNSGNIEVLHPDKPYSVDYYGVTMTLEQFNSGDNTGLRNTIKYALNHFTPFTVRIIGDNVHINCWSLFQ